MHGIGLDAQWAGDVTDSVAGFQLMVSVNGNCIVCHRLQAIAEENMQQILHSKGPVDDKTGGLLIWSVKGTGYSS